MFWGTRHSTCAGAPDLAGRSEGGGVGRSYALGSRPGASAFLAWPALRREECSNHARYITGQVLVVDGGVTLQGPERDSQDH
jgi:NAD(P)-dependent dehydrogenase (short-subunit alcohol dehydrogenase family)